MDGFPVDMVEEDVGHSLLSPVYYTALDYTATVSYQPVS